MFPPERRGSAYSGQVLGPLLSVKVSERCSSSQRPHSWPPAQGDGLSGSATEWGGELSRPPRSLSPQRPPTRTRLGVKLIPGSRRASGLNPPSTCLRTWGPLWGRGQGSAGSHGRRLHVRVSGCSGPVSTGNLPARQRLQRVPKARCPGPGSASFSGRPPTGSGTQSRESLHSSRGFVLASGVPGAPLGVLRPVGCRH